MYIYMYMHMYMYKILTMVRTSLARSLARSGVTKQARPASARLDSYWLGLERS